MARAAARSATSVNMATAFFCVGGNPLVQVFAADADQAADADDPKRGRNVTKVASARDT